MTYSKPYGIVKGMLKKWKKIGITLVILACDSGVCAIQSLSPFKIVVPALDTVGIGARDAQGNIFLMRKF